MERPPRMVVLPAQHDTTSPGGASHLRRDQNGARATDTILPSGSAPLRCQFPATVRATWSPSWINGAGGYGGSFSRGTSLPSSSRIQIFVGGGKKLSLGRPGATALGMLNTIGFHPAPLSLSLQDWPVAVSTRTAPSLTGRT